jgi:RND family efflux transporter MFP subunit
MKTIIRISLLFAVALIMYACKSENSGNSDVDSHDNDSSVSHSEEDSQTMVFLNDEQLKTINVQYGSIEKKQLTATMKANGFLKVPNQNKANATAVMGGVVKSILVQPGSFVRKGQTVALIVNTGFIKMQEELLSISYKADYAELEYARQLEMNSGNASSQKLLQQSKSELESLLAQEASLIKQLELVGINTDELSSDNIESTVRVRSPISGSISNVLVKIGSYVDPSNAIAEIVDNSRLHLDLFVYEKDLYKLEVGQTVHFTITNNPGKEYDADIFGIGNTFEDNSKAVAVHAAVKGNKTGLIDGMSITALVSLDNATVNAVPSSAIVNYKGQDYIFVLTDENAIEEEDHDAHEKEDSHAKENEKDHDHGHEHEKEDEHSHENSEKNSKSTGTAGNESFGKKFERIPVAKGTTDIGYSEITLLKDIPADSKIVVNGAFFLLGKMTNAGEGHAH